VIKDISDMIIPPEALVPVILAFKLSLDAALVH
jgi:hypothetical protein